MKTYLRIAAVVYVFLLCCLLIWWGIHFEHFNVENIRSAARLKVDSPAKQLRSSHKEDVNRTIEYSTVNNKDFDVAAARLKFGSYAKQLRLSHKEDVNRTIEYSAVNNKDFDVAAARLKVDSPAKQLRSSHKEDVNRTIEYSAVNNKDFDVAAARLKFGSYAKQLRSSHKEDVNRTIEYRAVNNNDLDVVHRWRWKVENDEYIRNLLKDQNFCNGNFAGYQNVFAMLKDIVIDPSKGHGRKGGENISEVLNQAESEEYFKLENGYFRIKCDEHITYAFKPKSHLNKWRDSLAIENSDPQYRGVVPGWTIAVLRYEYANLYHTMTDYYNAFLIAKAFRLQPENVTVLWIDGHPRGALDKTWDILFGKTIRAGTIQKPTLFKYMIWGIMGYDSPLNNHSLPLVPYLEEFKFFFLTRFNIPIDYKLNCEHAQILFLWRRDYLAHPRNPLGSVSRKVKNEDALLAAVKALLPTHQVHGVQIDVYEMHKQLEIISKTDILIGMHGAGLTHALFLPKHAGLIEFYPTYWPSVNKHFKAMAEWRGLHYLTWSNTDNKNELPDHYTIVDTTAVVNMVKEMHRRLCGVKRK